MSLDVCKEGNEPCCGCGSRKSGSDGKISPLSLSDPSRNPKTDNSAGNLLGRGWQPGRAALPAGPEEDPEAWGPRQ